MLKLIIADDEKWVRTAIKSVIPFDDSEFSLVSEASNGIEALELCRQHMPDILITDIKMPGLNGLELISELARTLPDIRIVVISGYNDFDYARTAMRYGVRDYLLKPVDEDELHQVLNRIKNEIIEREAQKRERETKQEQFARMLPVISEAFLNRLISRNTMTAEYIRSESQKYGIDLSGESFTVCVISPDTSLRENEDPGAYECYRTLVKRSMRKFAGAVTFPCESDRSLLVSIIKGKDARDRINRVHSICSRLLQKRLGISISCGVSCETHSPGMLQNLFPDAEDALEARFWKGPGAVTFHTPGCLPEDPKLSLQQETLNKIILNIKLSNLQTALSFVESISSSLKSERTPNCKPALVKEFFWQFIQSVITMLNIQLPFIHQETVVTGRHPYDRIREVRFLTELEDSVKELLRRIYDFYHDRNPVDNANIIENAKRIIESNYSGDISLEHVARHVHLNPAYLSELFKKQTGMSFIDYKTIVRIENAKKLLSDPTVTISEVSAMVGYSDPKYFSKLFKKITGKTVYEYKKGHS
ncbi:MAG TPA: response regulator [Clostridiales bacterium]|nr:response regulator [Clostridiales bacterium]HPV02700.1 response regulator [Clostridiales bacterium]